jgi:thiol:disulfide interchange protein DsbA
MKKFLLLFTIMLVSAATQAAQFSEGKHYQVIGSHPSSEPNVTEYFSLYCPHCYNFEPVIKEIKDRIPKNITFEINHVSFMGGDMGVSMAKAYATMKVLTVEDKLVPAMFRQIHDLNKAPKNDQELRQFFVKNGVDGDQFDATFNSFIVNSMQSSFDKSFENARLRSVPAVVINNVYLITASSVSSTDEYLALVNFLLEK